MKRFAIVSASLLCLCAQSSARGATVPSARQVAEKFYAAFMGLQATQLGQYYAPNVRFKDAIFQYADRAGTLKMWGKILGAKPSPRIRYSVQKVSGDTVQGRWIADYVIFGNPVHNDITSTMVIRNGQILQHTDAFPFATWAAQAFGLKGTHLEWLAANPHFQAIVVQAFRLGVNGIQLPTLCGIVNASPSLARVFRAKCARR